jgi:hypothetical protein
MKKSLLAEIADKTIRGRNEIVGQKAVQASR